MRTTRGGGRATLWILLGTALGIAVVASLWWGLRLRQAGSQQGPALRAGAPSRVRVEMAIEGMDCLMCAAGLQNELRALPGVAKAEVSYQGKTATIEYDPGLIHPVRLAETVEKSGFKIVPSGQGKGAGEPRPPSAR